MKILILNGSPKKDASDTMHLTRAFVSGMQEETACEVQTVHTIEKDVQYCTGCFSCMHNGGTCIHSDDMQSILAQICKVDCLIFSFPLYAYGMPAPLKVIVDRLLPLSSYKMQSVGEGRYAHNTQADVSHLKFVMICGCGFPNSKQNFEPAVAQFSLMFRGERTATRKPYVQCARGSRCHRAEIRAC